MKKIVYLLLLTGFGTLLGASPPFQAFLRGNPQSVHPIMVHDTVYLPLNEIAALFHLKADVDMQGRQIILEPETSPPPAGTVSPDPQASSILGEVVLRVNQTMDKPVLNVKVGLFKGNEKYDQETDKEAVQGWLLRNESFFQDTHGKVAETNSDASGRFAFSKIPPGNYEVVAVYPRSPRELGFWVKAFRMAKGETKKLTLSTDDLNTIVLKRLHAP